MTDQNQLKALRTTAKRFARAARIPLHQALDIVALQCGHQHWNVLTKAWSKGWRPSVEQLDAIPASPASPKQARFHDPADAKLAFREQQKEGVIDGHPYTLESDIMGVLIHGHGWGIYVDAAPLIEPEIEINKHVPDNPIDDLEFCLKALKIAREEAEWVREGIAMDWPRRSTRPDNDGHAVHPLFSNMRSATWYCLHCDGEFGSKQMATNMWHCPSCSATPIDIFPTPFWKSGVA